MNFVIRNTNSTRSLRKLTLTLHKNLLYFDCGSKLPFALPPGSREDLCELQGLRSCLVSVLAGVE